MPLFMDRHSAVPGEPRPSAADIAAAHVLDAQVQEKYNVHYLTYWFDQSNGSVFCLADAPSAEAAAGVHKEAHGLIANEIIPVEESVVRDFLGRLTDPPGAGLENPPADSAFRTIIFTDIEGSTAQTQKLGDVAAMEYIRKHNEIVRASLREHSGSEVKHTGDGIMASFVSATRAIESAIHIQRAFHAHNMSQPDESVHVRVGVSAGEPVHEHGDLFGATVQLARRVCDHARAGSIYTANVVRELCIGKGFEFVDRGEAVLKGFADPVRVHEVLWAAE
jgi:class 3 adenylate cyclase